jgi:hypothetical protein
VVTVIPEESDRHWSFDYFPCNAAKRSLRERFAASLVLAPIFPEALTQTALQEKSAQFSQKSRSSAACLKNSGEDVRSG